MTNANRLIFTDDMGYPDVADSFKGFLQKNISSAEQLLDNIADELRFPAYFGRNWNALADCLSDFHWIEEKKISLIHRDFPKIDADDLKIYLDVIRDAIDDWKQEEAHQFFVVFPAAYERRVKSLG